MSTQPGAAVETRKVERSLAGVRRVGQQQREQNLGDMKWEIRKMGEGDYTEGERVK